MTQGPPAPNIPEGADWIRALGTLLVGVGASMWIVYAVGRYWLGWAITDRGFLPYHLATILPGMLLRYHVFFFEDLPRRLVGEGRAATRAAPPDRGRIARGAALLNDLSHQLATGLWAACVVAIAILDRKASATGPGPVAAALVDVTRTLFWLAIAAVAVVLVTGALGIRRPAADRLERELRLVKAVLFAFAFTGGTYFAYLCAFRRVAA